MSRDCIQETPAITSSTIGLLMKPKVYPHKVGDFRLLETHISWVVLTGDFAYKIKKQCRFSFVDYSTLALRREFCFKELEYNRRLAAAIYMDVVPIFMLKDGELRVGGSVDVDRFDEKPIEYAVKMKQFSQNAILSARIKHHELTTAAVDQLGSDLACFHDSCERAGPDRKCVDTHRILHEARENIQTLNKALPNESTQKPILENLLRWTEKEFAFRAKAFEARLAEGFVRRCHGDMHLNNLVQLDEKIFAFDCIEFNEDFQWIDVMSDLAFPVMDFMAKARPDLGWSLLNSYLEGREDWSGLEIFRFYAVYRAMVRAKVMWLDQSQHGVREFGNAVESWDEYIQVASRIAFPAPSRLAITYGLSGSGKSTRAKAYALKEGAVRLRSDVERRRIAGLNPRDRYSPEAREFTYDRLWELAKQLLKNGYSVVVDATFLDSRLRRKFGALAASLSIPFEIIACDASVDELERRIKLRTDDASEANLTVLHRQLEEIQPLSDEERLAVVHA